ncbi:alginate lyase [Pseudodesulfovibrio cashew]|uniref:Alginate lyase n=1 Tax=Pseudodesulfovibrio cashew TaxID=2678688 RepID=A0A6I6JF37_9BACT|nr:alginate lyase family protein [Pseudodesulfovibrio cashew]QGY38597.1 alginate lyase [Pseudodesulfovibrio cashew]
MTRRIIPALTLLLILAAATAWAGKVPKTILYSPEVLAETKRRVQERDPAIMPAYRELLRQADLAIKTPAETVVFKPAPPPGGTKHDYWSVAPYWWPDEASPNGLPYVRHDGETNPEAASKAYDRQRLRTTAANALTLAQAWYLTGSEEYAGKGSALIWSWCCDSVTRMTPHLRFAQMRRGDRPGKWETSPSGIIEGRELIKIAEAARLLEPSHAWSAVVTNKLTKWFEKYLHWLLTSPQGRREAGADNNHGVWYDAQVAVIALYAGKTNLARSVVGTSAAKRLSLEVEGNGAMPRELERTRSRHYTFFTLEAFFTLAAVGDRTGIDLWRWTDGQGRSLRRAFDYAAPYLAKEEPWPFGHTGRYDPFAFTPLFHRAAMVYKEDRYRDYLKALPEAERLRDRAQLFH